jgi:predicted glycogen debranching enzyme
VTLPIRRLPWPPDGVEAPGAREWLVGNGLGGYACGTIAGAVTRRYHGLLVAALPAPHGRVVMLTRLAERVHVAPGDPADLQSGETVPPAPDAGTGGVLVEFRLEGGLPVWRYQIGEAALEKRIVLAYERNTVWVTYELLGGHEGVGLELRPWVHFRSQESPLGEAARGIYEVQEASEGQELALRDSRLPTLRMMAWGGDARFTEEAGRVHSLHYPEEESRGYDARGTLWSPGFYRAVLRTGGRATLVASTESFDDVSVHVRGQVPEMERGRRRRLLAQAAPEARDGVAAELVLAADAFVVTPAARVEEVARARAAGRTTRTVIAGYPWFTDWGRDTMIGLEGLTLVTGRHAEAASILRTFSSYVRDGLVPNMFPEGGRDGLYHTADASLWFFHAIDRYLAWSKDEPLLPALYPTLRAIVAAHVNGTRFGICVDPADGLLTQGAPGYQLTWMDAKVDGWVVTPRRGKAVEINALWYNALRLMERWARDLGDEAAAEFASRAEAARASFNARFWYGAGGYLYDVVDAERGGAGSADPTCRPNQVFAIALPHAVLQPERWEAVMNVVRERLLTPVGLRSLAPGEADYQGRYEGDLRARDAAYHQGTVWAWLIGPFVDAWLRVYPADRVGARRTVESVVPHLDEACVGSISEIFDGEPPYTPRGCIAQAWSVAELLRVWTKVARATTAP